MRQQPGSTGEQDMNDSARKKYLDAVKLDLTGPVGGADEVLRLRKGSYPRDIYITGPIGPGLSALELAEDHLQDQDNTPDVNQLEESDPGNAISMASRRGPTSLGVSFAIKPHNNAQPIIRATASGGFYTACPCDDAQVEWRRRAFCETTTINLATIDGHQRIPLTSSDGLEWYIRLVHQGDVIQTTLVLSNTAEVLDRIPHEESTLFQSQIDVHVDKGCDFAHRPVQGPPISTGLDEDARTNALLYRNKREWAVGHGSAATWEIASDRNRDELDVHPSSISTTWLPQQLVESMSPSGDPCLAQRSKQVLGDEKAAFSASKIIATKNPDELRELLMVLPDAYEQWIQQQVNGARLPQDSTLRTTLDEHARRAQQITTRIREGVNLICSDENAHQAFLLAQKAMIIQLGWSKKKKMADLASLDLVWRPFQLGFMLLTAAAIAGEVNGQPHPDRDIMDLLWFPTGGGKTEAYLGLAAFAIFYRRLSGRQDPERAAGVTILMRYTLRLLTIQQFERAARLVIACDTIRLRDPASLGHAPIGIGLWVGSSATPNSLKDAKTAEGEVSPRQLKCCPVCNEEQLRWYSKDDDFIVACGNEHCDRGDAQCNDRLPVHTIDEMIYRHLPTVVIGTVDKFAQIVRKAQAGAMLRNDVHLPPDLIIQDELHLISGPLGTVTGLYEAAIDRICTRNGRRPKVVGSTATIRRAADQVRALFDRDVCQFPPPLLDAENSCFAIVDRTLPGRLYVGVSTAGKSPKFSLQHLGAALLQRSAEDVLVGTQKDPYWTQLIYFNALRELGGALVMVHDDIPMTMNMLARLHGTTPRGELEHMELSSRLGSIDIPDAIQALQYEYPEQNYDVVLATNMISVGVDISRLGLMIINGQPKGMSEYIQASSRVGRNAVAGLVWTLYNSGRARDRSHYESFRTWHQALYSSVEASSVTPFSSRARERALHACLVALGRHVVAREHEGSHTLHEHPHLTQQARDQLEILLETLVTRGALAMAHVLGPHNEDRRQALEDEIRVDGQRFLNSWHSNAFDYYWNDRRPAQSLLISAEEATATNWQGLARATPNSMREVEPSATLRVVNSLNTSRSAQGE